MMHLLPLHSSSTMPNKIQRPTFHHKCYSHQITPCNQIFLQILYRIQFQSCPKLLQFPLINIILRIPKWPHHQCKHPKLFHKCTLVHNTQVFLHSLTPLLLILQLTLNLRWLLQLQQSTLLLLVVLNQYYIHNHHIQYSKHLQLHLSLPQYFPSPLQLVIIHHQLGHRSPIIHLPTFLPIPLPFLPTLLLVLLLLLIRVILSQT